MVLQASCQHVCLLDHRQAIHPVSIQFVAEQVHESVGVEKYLLLVQVVLLGQDALQAPEVQAFDVSQLVVSVEVVTSIPASDGPTRHLAQQFHEACQVVFISALVCTLSLHLSAQIQAILALPLNLNHSRRKVSCASWS